MLAVSTSLLFFVFMSLEVYKKVGLLSLARQWILCRQFPERAMNTMVKDLLIHRVDHEFVSQNVHPDTAATLHEGRVVALREEINFHFLWSP